MWQKSPFSRGKRLKRMVYERAKTHFSMYYYSLRSELLVQEMNVSRCILVVDTSIFVTSNSEEEVLALILVV